MRQAMRAWPFPALKKMAVACVPPSPSLFCCTTTPRPDSDKERMGEGRNPRKVSPSVAERCAHLTSVLRQCRGNNPLPFFHSPLDASPRTINVRKSSRPCASPSFLCGRGARAVFFHILSCCFFSPSPILPVAIISLRPSSEAKSLGKKCSTECGVLFYAPASEYVLEFWEFPNSLGSGL